MAEPLGIAALLASGAGLYLGQVGSLVPKREDFAGRLKLAQVACIETLAAAHCFLVKQFHSIGIETFDNEMRGDGRTSRDYFAEHAESLIRASAKHLRYNRIWWWFRALHSALLGSILALFLYGLSIAAYGTWAFSIAAGSMLVLIEIGALLGLYVIGALSESIE